MINRIITVTSQIARLEILLKVARKVGSDPIATCVEIVWLTIVQS